MIPGPQGPDLCQYLRKKYPTSSPPIMMMTAKASPEFIVEGLDSGADDYITKPFTMEVLLARVRGLLRRSYHTTHTIKLPSLPNLSAVSEETLLKSSSSSLYLKYGPLHLDESRHEISLLQKILNLTMSEFKILKSFMERPGHVYTRKQLIEKMSGQGIHVGGRTIDTQIVGLRKKLGDHGHLVETIRGVGYRLREIDDEP
jgi:two-component system phosphate regulon response regulator PhoB